MLSSNESEPRSAPASRGIPPRRPRRGSAQDEPVPSTDSVPIGGSNAVSGSLHFEVTCQRPRNSTTNGRKLHNRYIGLGPLAAPLVVLTASSTFSSGIINQRKTGRVKMTAERSPSGWLAGDRGVSTSTLGLCGTLVRRVDRLLDRYASSSSPHSGRPVTCRVPSR